MNKTLLLMTLLLSTQLGLAQNYTKKELVQMSVDRLFPNDSNNRAFVDMRDIIKEWNILFDAQNLKRDLDKNRVDWNKAFPIVKDRIHKISGKRVFYGMIPKKYHYTILEDARKNELVVKVKMHFYPSKTYLKRMNAGKEGYLALADLKKEVAENVAEVESRWNTQAPRNVRFRFEVVEKASEADYSIKLVTIFGALYDKFIVAPAYADILSHEVGHMMGLDDEYTLVTSNIVPANELLQMTSKRHSDRHMDYTSYKDMRCNLDSIMCLRDVVYDYHINHILGRMTLSK